MLFRELVCEWQTWWKNFLDNMKRKTKLDWGSHGEKFEDASRVGFRGWQQKVVVRLTGPGAAPS